MGLSWLWSRMLWMNRTILWLLFIVNFLGTVYGYIWYWNQLVYTYERFPSWLLVFVPDSPTASLFFTLALLYLLFPPPESASRFVQVTRMVIEGLAVVTSVKYGLWAVSMIVATGAQGGELNWQHGMLVFSHLGMAVEVLLYARFMKAGFKAVVIGTAWLLLNDTIDYTFGVFPWLADELMDDLPQVRLFTYGLTIFSFMAGWLVLRARKQL
ncbi:hypothetical protein BBD42_22245 [Paenibacillus sp. BIHB 4019]|uniref:DUF1405 domain-containing protein n=1 Tax=Paenibacillus sp. BIHB 4019 TaxID=1870819 RepID=A0A1B2DMG0_9BACL|nr:DUF1405 domain-containing protein [Paenibacillus sp. BIHB 4019]ANY68895.1 hypothetical protein BBD42_22245 [Paenibacillus sp. BIHB 4019]